MNPTRIYLFILLAFLPLFTHAQKLDLESATLKGPVKRYEYKDKNNRYIPFSYACYFDREGRKTIDSSYTWQRGTKPEGYIYLSVSKYTYDVRFAYVRTQQYNNFAFDTLVYDYKHQLIMRTSRRSKPYNGAGIVTTYRYFPDGRIQEKIVAAKPFIVSKRDGAIDRKTLYFYEPRKEFIASFYPQDNKWQFSTSTINYLDDKGQVKLIGYQTSSTPREYTEVTYSDAAESPPFSRKQIRKLKHPQRIYYNKDRYGNYLNILEIDIYKHETVLSIEYY